MRIIAGRYKGRILYSFPGREIRPTSDRLRETLFDILQAEVAGARVWDAFAGSGALGLEALSRGASLVVFTERSLEAFRLLEKNARLLDAGASVRLIQADAVRWAARSPWVFDLVFLDPPYNFRKYLDLALTIGIHRVCQPHGRIILEHYKTSPQVSRLLGTFRPDRQVRQGDSVLSFFSGEELIRGAGSPPEGRASR